MKPEGIARFARTFQRALNIARNGSIHHGLSGSIACNVLQGLWKFFNADVSGTRRNHSYIINATMWIGEMCAVGQYHLKILLIQKYGNHTKCTHTVRINI